MTLTLLRDPLTFLPLRAGTSASWDASHHSTDCIRACLFINTVCISQLFL